MLELAADSIFFELEPDPDESSEDSAFLRRIFTFSASTNFSCLGGGFGDSGFGGVTIISDAGRRRRMLTVAAGSSVLLESCTLGDEGGLTGGKSGGLVFVVSVEALTSLLRGSGFFVSTFSGSSSLMFSFHK